jgi:hypothetical protein
MPRFRAFLGVVTLLGAVSVFFYWRQNFAGQIGGAMSIAKLLWLDYAILSWFILPAFLCGSPATAQMRRLCAIHLINFGGRAVIELWLLYVVIGWTPLYGIAHDLFSIALITWLAPRHAGTERHFTWTLRLTLACEILFASLFHLETAGEGAIYFASDDPRFRMINTVTWIVVCAAYTDLAWVVARLRGVLMPGMEPEHA